jgi:hypothetical protein
MSGGVGYRRSDLFREQLDARGTLRAPSTAPTCSTSTCFHGLRTDRTSLRWYTKFEHSPQIDYFGEGNTSSKDARTSYRYDDFSSDFFGSFEPVRDLHFGVTGGYFRAHTARSDEEGLPPIDEAFPPASISGFAADTQYTRFGAFSYFDSRDSSPARGAADCMRRIASTGRGAQGVAFRQAEFEVQYFPTSTEAASSPCARP